MNRRAAAAGGAGKDAAMIVRTAQDAAALLEPLFASVGGEAVAVAYLDSARRVLDVAVEGRSAAETVDEAELPLRAIFARALSLGARAIVVAHNHPSGDPTPSEADKAATRELAETARRLDVLLHDHLVFGGGECRSFRALGLI
jgi:DNA repair protein RadC